VGAAVCIAWAFGASFIFFKVLDRFVPLRVSPEDEIGGLDMPEMGLGGYIPDSIDATGTYHPMPAGTGVPAGA
jgi:Amt family ammonium transporter